MCMKGNALGYIALAAAAIYTGGAALGAWGGTAAAGTGAAAGGTAAAAGGTAAAGASWATYAGYAATAISAYSAYQGMQGAQSQAEYNAAVARNNAQISEYQAQDAIRRGNTAAEDHSRKVAALAGTQRASLAARGLDISEGTPVDLMTDTELLGTYDTNTIKDNAAKEAWGYRTQASNSRATAGQYDTAASNMSPLMAAGGSLLSGAASVADKWYRSSNGLRV